MLALEKLDQHDEVLKCCEILLSKNDKDVDALVTGIALNKTGNHEDALTLYDLALELDKTNVDALMNMAVTLSYLEGIKNQFHIMILYNKLCLIFLEPQLKNQKRSRN